MGELLAGLAMVVVGLALFAAEHHEFGLFNLAFGLFFAWRGVRKLRRASVTEQHIGSAGAHAAELWSRAEKGESPDQLARSFETQYQIPPMQTLEYIAVNALHNLGRGTDAPKTQALLGWFSAYRQEPLPTPVDVIEHLDLRTNLFGTATGVALFPESGKPTMGALVASRTYLFFLPYGEVESLAGETAKETIMNALPAVVGLASLAKTMAEGVKAELVSWDDPKLIAELKHRLTLPGGIAVPWRELAGVRKEEVDGKGFAPMRLVVGYGDPESPELLTLSHGNGFDEAWVDNWIDIVRSATILEGRLLLV